MSRSDWALVTGAAGGIGRAFAQALAARGYNLVLADISENRLSDVVPELGVSYGVEVRSLAIDLSFSGAARELYDFCVEQGIFPQIAINNAGIFSYQDLVMMDSARIETMVGLHVTTMSLICRLFGAEMAAHKAGGHILNMSSYSAWMPWPGIATYSATKSYIRNFSLALAGELRGKGVYVTTVLPAGVTTNLYGLSPRLQNIGRRLGILMTPEKVVEKSLRAMFRGRRQYIPGLMMRLVLPVVRALPQCIIRFARQKTLKYML